MLNTLLKMKERKDFTTKEKSAVCAAVDIVLSDPDEFFSVVEDQIVSSAEEEAGLDDCNSLFFQSELRKAFKDGLKKMCSSIVERAVEETGENACSTDFPEYSFCGKDEMSLTLTKIAKRTDLSDAERAAVESILREEEEDPEECLHFALTGYLTDIAENSFGADEWTAYRAGLAAAGNEEVRKAADTLIAEMEEEAARRAEERKEELVQEESDARKEREALEREYWDSVM